MSKAKRQQPRALSPALPIQGEGLVRQGMNLALYQLDKQDRRPGGRQTGEEQPYQLMLGETAIDGQELQIAGSLFTLAENRVLHALYIMLHDRGYIGDKGQVLLSESQGFSDTGGKVRIHEIVCSPSEFLDAYGLQRGAGGRYSSHQREEALSALLGLGRTIRKLSWQRPYKDKRGKRAAYRVIIESTILTITRLYTGLEGEEIDSLEEPDVKRMTGLQIQLHPIMTDRLEQYFFLQERDYYPRLRDSYSRVTGKQGGRIPEAIDLFLKWLRTLNPKMLKRDAEGLYYVTIGREGLIEKILPPGMKEHRRKARQEKALQECISVAVNMGLLLKWEPAMLGQGYTFWPNPERSSRLYSARLPAGDTAERAN